MNFYFIFKSERWVIYTYALYVHRTINNHVFFKKLIVISLNKPYFLLISLPIFFIIFRIKNLYLPLTRLIDDSRWMEMIIIKCVECGASWPDSQLGMCWLLILFSYIFVHIDEFRMRNFFLFFFILSYMQS